VTAYYNEIDLIAAQWLRNLISKGLIADGDVDTRSIVDVKPNDIRGYDQCHFFAGIGVWSRALRLSNWQDSRNVWTGSCPCQPFSAAGKGGGFDDERHLWPYFHYLIEQCKPHRVFGEQVASKDGLSWIDLVQDDMEGTGYAIGAFDICAAGFGAPHIRQRLYWMADSADSGRKRGWSSEASNGTEPARLQPERLCNASRLANADGGYAIAEGLQRSRQHGLLAKDGRSIELGNANSIGEDPFGRIPKGARAEREGNVLWPSNRPTGPTNGFWQDADWLLCRDGEWRPVEPGTFPLAHGATSRMGRLRAYGNAIRRFASCRLHCRSYGTSRMKYTLKDVVWCRTAAKAAVVIAVGDKYYQVRSYDGVEFSITEKELGRK
jgi:DNA (cytosine-5)-methyltransferase 1